MSTRRGCTLLKFVQFLPNLCNVWELFLPPNGSMCLIFELKHQSFDFRDFDHFFQSNWVDFIREMRGRLNDHFYFWNFLFFVRKSFFWIALCFSQMFVILLKAFFTLSIFFEYFECFYWFLFDYFLFPGSHLGLSMRIFECWIDLSNFTQSIIREWVSTFYQPPSSIARSMSCLLSVIQMCCSLSVRVC